MSEGTLTTEEREALQRVADLFQATIDVVGSRGASRGRNIYTELPFGKGGGTRSDVDVRVDARLGIDTRGALSNALYDTIPGVSVGSRRPGGSHPPYIAIRPTDEKSG